MLAPWITTVALACLAGAAAFLGVGRARTGRGRLWCWGLTLLGVAAPIAAAVTIFIEPELVLGPSLTWFRYGFYAGETATIALVIAWAIGHRTPGRRRCPSCGYDMAGVPSLACPECGRTARSERRLERWRRPRRALLAAALPLALCSLMWASAIFGSGDWERRLPTTALVLAAPFVSGTSSLANEIAGAPWWTEHEYSLWQRWVLVGAAHARLSIFDDSGNIFYATRLLIRCDARGSIPTARLIKLTHDADRKARTDAIMWLSYTRTEPELAKARLIELTETSDPRDALTAVCFLSEILETVPGGDAPDQVLSTVETGEDGYRYQAIEVVALCDPSERSRAALLAAAENSPVMRPHAIAAIAALWPDEEPTRLLVTPLLEGDIGASSTMLQGFADTDDRLRARHGSLPKPRLRLYSGELGAAIEKRIGEIERHDLENAHTHPRAPFMPEAVARTLRQSLADARRTNPPLTPPRNP